MEKSISLIRPALMAALLLFSLSGRHAPVSAQEVSGETPSDSLAFEIKKRKILENTPDVRMAAVVEAAEDLARDGFFAEALELIYDLEDTAWSKKAEKALEEELGGAEALARSRGREPLPGTPGAGSRRGQWYFAKADSALAAANSALIAAEITLTAMDSILAASDSALTAEEDSAWSAADSASDGGDGAARDSILAGSGGDSDFAARDGILAARDSALAARDKALATRDSIVAARDDELGDAEDVFGFGAYDFDDLDTAMPALAAAKPAPSIFQELQSYVRSSLEYDNWDGSPVGGEVRAKLEWLPEGRFLERVTPTFAGSDRRAFFGLAARGSAFGRLLKVSAEALAEKKMWQTYGDSLDRISALAVVEAGTRPLGRTFSISLPLRGEVEQYRYDRLGLLSRHSLGAAPALEAVSADWRKSALVAWEARTFRFPSSRPSDFLRQGPYLMANWYGDHFTAELEAQVMDDSYRRDTSMFASRAWEGRASAFVRPFRRLKAGMRFQHNGEFSRYADTLRTLTPVQVDTVRFYRVDTLVGLYNLEGRVTTVQPVITLEWASVYSASLSLAYARGWYPLIQTYGGKELFPALFIDESFTAWKPEATFSVLSRKLFLNASVGYELHKPSISPHYYTGYSEVLGMAGNLSWKLGRYLEVDFSGLYRAQTKGAASAALDMTSLSAGFTSRFQ